MVWCFEQTPGRKAFSQSRLHQSEKKKICVFPEDLLCVGGGGVHAYRGKIYFLLAHIRNLFLSYRQIWVGW